MRRSACSTRIRSLVIGCGLLALGACGGNTDSAQRIAETTSVVSPNLWIWRATHLGRTHRAFALFDGQEDRAVLIVGHVPWASNIPASLYAFEVQTLEDTIHLQSLGAFQPHGNCIQGDFEFAVTPCDTGSDFELCGTLIDLESGDEVTMGSFSAFNVAVPAGWEWEYSADDTLGDELADHIDLAPMLNRMTDEVYKKNRVRATSRFLRGAFNVSAGLPERFESPRIKQRSCEDAGRGVVRALVGKENAQYISSELP